MSKEKELEGEEERGEVQDKIKKKMNVGGSSSSCSQPQDADYDNLYTPSLSDEIEVSILARVPRSEHWKLSAVNKRFLSLVRNGDLYKIRKEIGFREPSVFILASGESNWWGFDQRFKLCRKLPVLPSDMCFTAGDKETLSAGTHLMVSGNEISGLVIWRYELLENKWFKGPSMINPRCMFASATCGNYAFVSGGIGNNGIRQVLRSAERYDPVSKSWKSLPGMHQRRKSCSGCYMDNKFFVIGGKNEEEKTLTCGEAFDVEKNKWDYIPDILKDTPVSTFDSPPLIAVVNNELYRLETSSNEVKVYMKGNNLWKTLGPVPIRADSNKGWGVAFKSLGSELLVIGASLCSTTGHGMSIYTCCPNPNGEELHWVPLDCRKYRPSHFILNCCVMIA